MRLFRRIYTFINACLADAQACKGRMTKLAIVAAVIRDLRPTPRTFVSRGESQLGEMSNIAYCAVQADT
jgi:hypothetical protein